MIENQNIKYIIICLTIASIFISISSCMKTRFMASTLHSVENTKQLIERNNNTRELLKMGYKLEKQKDWPFHNYKLVPIKKRVKNTPPSNGGIIEGEE